VIDPQAKVVLNITNLFDLSLEFFPLECKPKCCDSKTYCGDGK
jgi:hypothetical protein